MQYLGVDPSVRATAVAYRPGLGNLWLGGCHPISQHREIKSLLAAAWNCGVRVAVIERTINAGPSRMIQDALAEVRGQVLQMCLDFGFGVAFVTPAEWQPALLGTMARGGKTPKDRQQNRVARKRQSIMVARSLGADTMLLGEPGKENDNVADAVNICHYAHLNELGVEAA